MSSQDQITELLIAHRDGDRDAFDRLLPMVYDDLRRIARSQLRRIRPGETLNTTALVHEAYVKLVDQAKVPWGDRSHFFGIAARAMRQIIVDYARERGAQKRGGGKHHVPLDENQIAIEEQAEMLLALDTALDRLNALSERLTRVVECRFFGGLTEEETATTLGVSKRTVQRDWIKAKGWLRKEMGSAQTSA